MPRYMAVAAVIVPLLLAGCNNADRQDAEYRVNKAEGQRNRLQNALDDERAKVAILEERLAAQGLEHETACAELSVQRERTRQLEQENAKLLALIEQHSRQSLQPPSTPASPLPADVDQRLQAFARKHRGRVTYDRGRAAVSFTDDRLFASGSDQVRPEGLRTLGELAGIAALTPADEYEIIVVGHTDDTPIGMSPGRFASNWHLSVYRAISVKNALVAAGLPERRLGVMGYGPYRPISDDKTRNRRVEVFFARRGEVKPLPPIDVPTPPVP